LAAASASASGSRRVDAALQTRGAVAREDIVAARRARREKEKAARAPATGPARYRRKRTDNGSAGDAVATQTDGASLDPLDAQNAGLHDDALEQGHEEINLNLEDFEIQQDAQAEEAPGIAQAAPDAPRDERAEETHQ
jgi:hypothetical protein